MKGFLIVAAFGLGVLGATVLTTGTALASGENDHRIYGSHSVHNYFGALLYGSPHHYRQDHRNKYRYRHPRSHRHVNRHGHRKHSTYLPKRRAHNHRNTSYHAIQSCHATSKAGFDDYGRRVRIGGTMCYNAYGAPYIVRGSRHIIRYY